MRFRPDHIGTEALFLYEGMDEDGKNRFCRSRFYGRGNYRRYTE